MINFVRFWKIGNVFSIILICIAVFSVATKNFNFGIDFTGGVLIEAQSKQSVSIETVRLINKSLEELKIKSVIQNNGQYNLIIKIQANENNQKQLIDEVKNILSAKLMQDISFEKIDFIGPQISKEFFIKSFLAIIFAFIGIAIYLIIRFNFRFAIGGIIGLIHDVIITFGFISIFSIELNIIAITAILTVIGYSINDSVIIYDRIREILKLNNGNNLKDNINISLNNTFTRTLFTSITTLLSILALIVFGGKALYSFSFVVFIGILIGTYSSIIVASQVITLLPEKKLIASKSNFIKTKL